MTVLTKKEAGKEMAPRQKQELTGAESTRPGVVFTPAVDIFETDNGVVLEVELPGVSKADVSVEVKDNLLTLKGERLLDPEIKDEHYYRKERNFGKFNRSFSLQEPINPDLIKASFKDGVLTIDISRPEEEKPRQVTVDIE